MLTPPGPRPSAAVASVEALEATLDALTIGRPAAVRVLSMIDDPNATVPRLAAAVELDPVLTAQIMRLANSAFYGMSGRVGNTNFAVTVIGFSAVRSLAAVNATGLSGEDTPKPARFWEHAAGCAAAAASLAPLYGIPNGDAFAAGLLHDLGQALLHRFDPIVHRALIDEWGDDGLALAEAEARTMGLGHPGAAARVLRAWNFPAPMVAAVAEHHAPCVGAEPFTRLLVAADALTHHVDRGVALDIIGDGPVDDDADDDHSDANEHDDGSIDKVVAPDHEAEDVAGASDSATDSDADRQLLIDAGVPEDQIDHLVLTVWRKSAEVFASLPVV